MKPLPPVFPDNLFVSHVLTNMDSYIIVKWNQNAMDVDEYINGFIHSLSYAIGKIHDNLFYIFCIGSNKFLYLESMY